MYILGPMSGVYRKNHPAFFEAAAFLRGCGYEVENPAENRRQPSWAGYMKQSIPQMLTCDIVACLPGWEDSAGASKEHTVAKWLDMPAIYL